MRVYVSLICEFNSVPEAQREPVCGATHTATRCNTRYSTHCNGHCNTHCNTLQHTATQATGHTVMDTATHTATHTAAHCNTRYSTHYNGHCNTLNPRGSKKKKSCRAYTLKTRYNTPCTTATHSTPTLNERPVLTMCCRVLQGVAGCCSVVGCVVVCDAKCSRDQCWVLRHVTESTMRHDPSISPLILLPRDLFPVHTLQIYMHTQKSHIHTQKSPVYTEKSPSHTQESPSLTQEIPSLTQESPSHTQESPVRSRQAACICLQ